jgi:Fe-S-cluster containining protein
MGLYWYCSERLTGDLRGRVAGQLGAHEEGQACPFLVDGACAVHPMRPMACRQFNVFDRVCAEGEDAFHTRRGDVMTPLPRFADQAFDRMLPFYGITDKRARKEAIKTGRLHALARVLQGLDWAKLAARMGGGTAPDGDGAGPP